ncbi:MAG TPA: sialidase family protein [Actinomycetes bacterium]
MRFVVRPRQPARLAVVAVIAALALLTTIPAAANVALTRVSTDTFTNPTSQHATQVEPDTFASGSTIVSAFQTGRFFDGGASGIAVARSGNSGATWTTTVLPGITTFQGGPYDRVSDPAVAFEAQDNAPTGVWLVSSLAIRNNPVRGVAVITSRSTNGGVTWSNPVTTATGSNLDKNWIACDNNSASPFFGNCYTEFDENADGNRIKMSTSTNGGLNWGAALNTGDSATGLGGQPVVRPNGTVLVPIANANETQIRSFRSINGGASWRATVLVSNVTTHTVAGGLRSGPLPSAEIDSAGTAYVVWQDCRFRSNCSANDIVMSKSTTETTWGAVTRVPIDATNSGRDHFIPGIGVDRTTSGGSARIGLTYYFYPVANCTAANCQLDVGYVSSTNGGSTWSAPTMVTGPMTLSWLANTSQGRMVGDYISTSVFPAANGGRAYPVIAVANPPSGTVFDEAMYVPAGGLAVTGGALRATSAGARRVPVSGRGGAMRRR